MHKPIGFAAALSCCMAPAALGNDVETFYKGQRLQLIVSTAPGTGYDMYARTLSRHMPRHMPGNPPIIVQNMPGAGGLNASAHVYNIAPKDGTVFATVQSGIPTEPVFRPEVARFDASKFSWIGSANRETNIMIMWHAAPALTPEEMRKTEVVLGAVGLGTTGVDMPVLANALFGFRFKVIPGYKGSPDIRLAMERGEVHGYGGETWSSVRGEMKSLLDDRKVRVVLQYGFARHPELADVPLLIDFAQSDSDRQALQLLMARQEFGRPFMGPPGIPPERLNALRRAFDASMIDKEFVAEAEKLGLEISPLTGEQVGALVDKLAATPRDIVQRVGKLLAGGVAGKN